MKTLLSSIALSLCLIGSVQAESLTETSQRSFVQMSYENEQFLQTGTEPELVQKSQTLVQQLMKDPSSAQFQNTRVVRSGSFTVVCGEYNAKNSYGAYTGFKPFATGTVNTWTYTISRVEWVQRDANQLLIQICLK